MFLNKKKNLKVLVTATPFCENSLFPKKILKDNEIDYNLNPKKRKLTEVEIFNLIKPYDGIIADLEPLNKKVLSNAKNLKIISRVGIGVDNIDLKYAKTREIVVANTPDAPTEAVIELNLSLIFALIRNLSIHNNDIRNLKWERKYGLSIKFLKIGILGLGRIGLGLSEKLFQIGASEIYYNDLFKKKTKKKLIYKSKDYIFRNCDVLCLTLPETNKTTGLLNKKVFKKMKKDSFLINTSRGDLINEKDLIHFLKKGYFSGVGLDVFHNEPYKGELIKFKRCILTPHIGSHTIDTRNRMEIEATKNLVNFFKKNKKKNNFR